jgi:LEA14-like dessication related protein
MRFSGFLVTIFTMSILSSCSVYKPVTFGDVKGIELKGISAEGINFTVLIPVKNPNSYNITVENYNFDVGIENTIAGNVSNNGRIVIPAKSEEIQKFPVKAKITDIFSGLTTAYKIFSQPETEIQIKGTAKVKALFLSKKIDIDQKQKVNIKK